MNPQDPTDPRRRLQIEVAAATPGQAVTVHSELDQVGLRSPRPGGCARDRHTKVWAVEERTQCRLSTEVHALAMYGVSKPQGEQRFGPPVLIGSPDLYRAAESDMVVVVPVRGTTWMGPRLVTESVRGGGVAELDRLTSVPRGWLAEYVLSSLEERHADIGRHVRNLIDP
ncbi:hypothetical protein HNP84_006031 [Thermocatellispora tengchongensis]|uniref:Uncharacterized protein n=1 Tax=Thermocatellispora tengchongensis TaxID=1073253 RepID=A0A840PGM1_9ACTN|nr:hypothetical protein [Thermocatellispora tengchongensis]MBB5136287.1 hypothetical protein [Thermocatellispora tengchongensis]